MCYKKSGTIEWAVFVCASSSVMPVFIFDYFIFLSDILLHYYYCYYHHHHHHHNHRRRLYFIRSQLPSLQTHARASPQYSS
jgi:hypothetical protein